MSASLPRAARVSPSWRPCPPCSPMRRTSRSQTTSTRSVKLQPGSSRRCRPCSGTPLIMMPRQVTRSVKSTGSPSTANATSPSSDMLNPVARLTTMSAAISAPEQLTLIPCSVNVSMVSVTIDAVASRSVANRSPSQDDGDALLPQAVAGREVFFHVEALGQQRAHRLDEERVQFVGRFGRHPGEQVGLRHELAAQDLVRPLLGDVKGTQLLGELVRDRRGEEVRGRSAAASSRCSAFPAIAGISVAAVAPEPMTMTQLALGQVEVRGPPLLVHDHALEAVHAIPLRLLAAWRGCSSPGTSSGSPR